MVFQEHVFSDADSNVDFIKPIPINIHDTNRRFMIGRNGGKIRMRGIFHPILVIFYRGLVVL